MKKIEPKKLCIASIAILLISGGLTLKCQALSVGVMSDIHAGGRSSKKDIAPPNKNFGYFETALRQMKLQGVEVVAVLGDLTNDGKKGDYDKLGKLAKKYGMKMLWVKGNHDNNKISRITKTQYIYDTDEVRFIVLDTSYKIDGRFDIGDELFLKGHLDTEKRVIVLQHQPPFIRDTFKPYYLFNDEQKMAPEIWCGHWHRNFEIDNVHIFTALSKNKKLNYKIINL